jgi:NAD-dependent DNA ligase
MAIEMAKMKKVIDQFKLTFYQRFPKIRYMELPTMDAFVDFLITNHTQMTLDGQSGLNRIPEFVKVKNSKKADDRVNLLTSVGGVTNTMAIDLLEHFGSIPQILHSRRTQKDLMEVKGIGRTKAKKILDLRKKY